MAKFTRRQFLKMSSLLFAGTGATLLTGRALSHGKFPLAEKLGDSEDEIVAGTIALIEPTGIVSLQSSEKTIKIYFADGTFFSRGNQGVVSGINDYVLGDKVVADGTWEGDVFRAHTFESIYQLVEGTVTARLNDSLKTTGGTLLISQETKPAKGYTYEEKPLNEIAVGDEIGALVWHEPGEANYLTLRIGVAEGHSHQ